MILQAFRYFMLINLCAIAASCGNSLGGDENITAAVLQTIAVTPANPSIAKGLTNQFIAAGTYSDGTSVDISASVIWSSDITTVATVNSSGLASGAGVGTATISATSGVISGSTTLRVTAAVLQSITVTPATPSIAKGRTQQFTATGTYTDGTFDITNQGTWTSGITTVAIMNISGLATGVGAGTATITATSGVISGNTTLTVIEGDDDNTQYKMSFSDDYSGGLSAWTQTDGTWSVADGYLLGSPSGLSVNIYYNTPTATTSQWIQAKFKNMHDSDSMGMILWARDLSFTSQLYCFYNAGTFWVGYNDLQKKDHNYSPACRYTLADGHYVGFEASGTSSGVTMKIYDNGTSPAPRPWSGPICTWTDLDASGYTYGRYVGLWIYHKTGNYSYDVFGPVSGGDQ